MNARDQIRSRTSPGEPPVKPEPLTGLTGFKRNLLLAISRMTGERPHGLELKRKLEEFYNEEINHGRLYQNLSELVEMGFVDKRPVDGRTNAYRLTTTGRLRLKAHHHWETECLLAGEEAQ
jgi:DNA-binding PadR family transcriptional regulator